MSRRQKAVNRKRPQRTADRGPVLFVGGAAIAVSIAMQFTPSSRNFREMKSEVSQLQDRQEFQSRVLAAESKAKAEALEAELEARELEARQAHIRFYSGCIITFLPKEPGERYASKVAVITTDFRPIDKNTGKPFPPKTEVCDDRGTTAEIGPDGYVDMSTVARATDMDIVNNRFASAADWNPRAHRSEIQIDQ
ncbi:hypothetical protein [Leptolyngbya sp. Heron Island J]|uniref:hypothetical protein n=1 Tax=Leptolyngbya sp. Heron Island J TaxID=1385935 RepID=UPI0004CE9276|nr:hypothetical protein [Leptolyngbya sp. Heron Island J]